MPTDLGGEGPKHMNEQAEERNKGGALCPRRSDLKGPTFKVARRGYGSRINRVPYIHAEPDIQRGSCPHTRGLYLFSRVR